MFSPHTKLQFTAIFVLIVKPSAPASFPKPGAVTAGFFSPCRLRCEREKNNHMYGGDVQQRKRKMRPPFLSKNENLLFASGDEESNGQENLKVYDVSLSTPMGLILEEKDENDPSKGVVIASIDPQGFACASSLSIIRRDLSKTTSTETASNQNVVCIHDVILGVNGKSCAGDNFDSVMSNIMQAASENEQVTLTLGRPSSAVVVRWPNGVCIAAKSGRSIGELADECGMQKSITYSCRNGSCGTCQQAAIFVKKKKEKKKQDKGSALPPPRYVLPCVARVPGSGYESVTFLQLEGM